MNEIVPKLVARSALPPTPAAVTAPLLLRAESSPDTLRTSSFPNDASTDAEPAPSIDTSPLLLVTVHFFPVRAADVRPNRLLTSRSP